MSKLSIIIPVYNSENYIINCLKSFKDYNDIEVIIVNDGSTDNSKKLIEEYIKDRPIFKLYNTINQGTAKARRHGIEKSTGDYICFVDSDDTINIKSLINLYKIISSEAINIGIGRVNFYSPHIMLPFHNKKRGNRIIDVRREKTQIASLSSLIWNKIYHRKVIENYNSDRLFNEDLDNIPFLLASSEKLYHSDDVIYNYLIRIGSMSFIGFDTTNVNAIKNTVYPLISLKKKFVESGLYEFYKEEVDAIFIKNFFERMQNIKYNKNIQNKQIMISLVLDIMTNLVPDWQENTYYQNRFSEFELTDQVSCFLLSNETKKYTFNNTMDTEGLLKAYEKSIIIPKK